MLIIKKPDLISGDVSQDMASVGDYTRFLVRLSQNGERFVRVSDINAFKEACGFCCVEILNCEKKISINSSTFYSLELQFRAKLRIK